jgi:uncharacterized protein YbjT (DUF2867 family)
MGSNLAPALAAHGWHVRAVARKAFEAAGVRRIAYLGGIMPKEQLSRHKEGRTVRPSRSSATSSTICRS